MPKPWPRDLRGRLRANATAIDVWLPGVTCTGGYDLRLTCKPSDEPWQTDVGMATFVPNRNYFDGKVVTPEGVAKTLPPFFSAAFADDLRLFATLNGNVEIRNAALDLVGNAGVWGSDIVSTGFSCGGRRVLLGSAAGDGPETIRAFTMVNGAPVEIGNRLDLPGPVTSLWDGHAVVRNGSKYQAYGISVTCAQ
jgi:hypothetical protein